MVQYKGSYYLKRLSTQNIASMRVIARQVLDQVIAGEFAISLQMYNHHIPISAAQGAPVAVDPDAASAGRSIRHLAHE